MEFTEEQKLYAEVVNKAWEDEAFKAELVADPVGAIEKLTGKKLDLPAGKTLVVKDQTDDSTVYINIPPAPVIDAELNEEELEAVAGGAVDPFKIIDLTKIGGTGPYAPTPTFSTGS